MCQKRASENKFCREKRSARIAFLQLKQVVSIINLTVLHNVREENYHALYTNACIILPLLYKKIQVTWIKSRCNAASPKFKTN